MAKVNVINLKGEKLNDLKLNDEIFNIEVNDIVLKKAIDLQLASLRQGTAKTKTRSEVRGGGRKPWKQKGTGRARQGSRRAPNWVGGGVVFGVTPRSFTFKMNKKERVLALKSALTHKAKDKEIIVIDSLEINSIKTKDIRALMSTLKLDGKVLFITKNDAENLFMATRNLKNVYVIMADEVSVLDLIDSDKIVCESDAVKAIEEGLI